jgi:Flp pilus assembly protein TadD
MMLRADPDNVALHNDVALLYAQTGNREQVAAHFAAAVRITPDSAAAHYNLGTALFALGRRDEARRDYLRAVELDPGYGNAYRGLGIVLQSEGKIEEAGGYYRQAIERAPTDAVAHHNLGMLLQVQGKFGEAVGQYRDALRIDGNYVDALIDLAWALATAPDPANRQPEEALRLAQRGAQLTVPQTSVVLDVLAAALAAAGLFDQAVTTAETALSLASAAKDDRSVRDIGQRLELYRRRTPFRQAP